MDAFLLYNEHEEVIERVAAALEKRDISTHYWRRDVGLGEPINTLENERLQSARAVVVLLGSFGWGPNHLQLTLEAVRLGKRIIPVLIGDAPPGASAEAGGLFNARRFADLRRLDETSFDALAAAIRTPQQEDPRGGRFDAIVRTFTDGNDRERADMLRRIIESTSIDRVGLAARLRSEIRDRYNPGSEQNYATAIRDPKKIASVRSWMLSALIWSNPDSGESRSLILQHLQPSYEPDQAVRFWALSGLNMRRVSYLSDALETAASDPALEVSGLAGVIARPQDDRVIADLRRLLHGSEFSTVWAALRIIRVAPVAGLVSDVCDVVDLTLDERPLTYDALYALAQPAMASAAVPILMARFGVSGVLNRVLAEVRIAGGNTLRDFAMLLAVFDPSTIDLLLAEASSQPDTAETAWDVRRALAELRPSRGNAIYVADYNSDTIDVKREFLGIDEDVQTLTAVMLARRVKPPLAIGLFGDWGSGKSYFMKSMNVAADELSRRAKDDRSPHFCHDIVQIEFNAWHYADTNLWANLVSTILERLAAFVTPRPTPEEQQAALLNELGSAKSSIDEAKAVKAETEQAIAQSQEQLVSIQRDRQKKEVTLRDLHAADVKKLLDEQPAMRDELDKALTEAGVPALLNSSEDLARAVAEAYSLQGRAISLFVSFGTSQSRWLLVALVTLVIAVPIGIHALLGRFAGGAAVVSTAVSEIVLLVGGIATAIGTATRHVAANLKRIEVAKASVDRLLEAKRAEQDPEERELQASILKLKAQEREASARLAAAASRVTELEERIRTMQEARSLARFLDDRTSSDDYRKYLGLISTVRRDFEALSKRLEDARTDGTKVKSVDRIILYIDDLDRCPAAKVLEVLQAVHLLLAYELFVVVVGVDPRWLLHSLERTHTAFQHATAETSGPAEMWVTTPRDYLEKIFQIPFSVLPMSEAGYTRLISDLLAPARGKKSLPSAPETAPPDSPAGGATDGARTAGDFQPTAPSETPRAAPDPQPRTDNDSSKTGGAAPRPDAPAFSIHEEALAIQPWEEEFATRLFPLIPTPRAAKRFSNVYRILKAPVRREELPQFEGSREAPGDFRVVMLLLAMLIGAPAEAAELFPQLYRHADTGGDMRTALLNGTRSGTRLGQAAPFQSLLTSVVDENLDSAAAFRKWLPRVSRFSFDVGRGLAR